MNQESVINSIKESFCHIPSDDTSFDDEIYATVNASLQLLAKIGGCSIGTTISSTSTTWSDVVSDSRITDMARLYVGRKCQLQFDPPSSSSAVTAINEAIKEFEWAIQEIVEGRLN